MPEDLIKAAATVHNLPWSLVFAICEIESSMNTYAMRYEPQYKYLVGQPLEMSPTERVGQMISWGLMQVMGAVAREAGFQGSFPQLCEPMMGLEYGCRHLRKFQDRWQNWQDSIASYNAGNPRKMPNGLYFNQGYVDRVLVKWKTLDPSAMYV